MHKNIALIFSLIFIEACSPIKGYPGPDLPPEKIALVTTSSGSYEKFLDAQADEIPFAESGIALLPGKHNFRMMIATERNGKDCNTYQETNYNQYDSCLKDQDKARRKNALVIPTCNIDNYTTTKQSCLVPYVDYVCEGTGNLSSGCEYQLEIHQRYSPNKVEVTLDLEKAANGSFPNKSLVTWKCRYLGERVEQEIS